MNALTETKLSDVCAMVTDGTHDSPKLQTEGVPFIKGKHIKSGQIDFENCDYITDEEHQKCIKRVKPQIDDVLMANIGASIGDCARVVDDLEFSIKNVALLRPAKDKLDPDYFHSLIKSRTFQSRLMNLRLGAAQPYVSLDALRKLEIPVFQDINAQKKIGAILSAYDDLIENNRRRIALLEEAARLIYREWFVHFRFPNHKNTEFSNGLPLGWKSRPLIQMAEMTMGQSPNSKFYNNLGEGLPFHQGVSDYGVRFVSDRVFSTKTTKLAQAGDILFSVRAPVGRLNYTLRKIVLGRGLAALKALDGNQSYLFYALKNAFFKEDLIGSGAIFAATNKRELEQFELICPDKASISAFESIVRPIDDQIKTLALKNRSLSKARDLLLPRLMDGRVTV